MTTRPSNQEAIKLFPRNLTARADYLVRGNPVNSRPESGVDNSFPGLEFDQRNLEKAFFPGLRFEYQRDEGAVLRSLVPESPPARAGLLVEDLSGPGQLFLLGLKARARKGAHEQDLPPDLQGLGGLDVWHRIRELGPGRIAILIGPLIRGRARPSRVALSALESSFRTGKSNIRRQGGRLVWAVFVGQRSRYIDPDSGVIEPDDYGPGELTQSLCAPWQYDFRDCSCFYWAAAKPDLVASADGVQPYLNFQRRDRSTATPDTPPQRFERWSQERVDQELGYAELINGAWNLTLPVVLNDRESEEFTPAPTPPVKQIMSFRDVVAQLNRLATVEHALSVEYLYAHYSLNAPSLIPPLQPGDLATVYALDEPVFPPGMSARTLAIANAANEILRIAVDEMRHLRWVNEALQLLGQEAPSLDRARTIKVGNLERTFTLEPLTFKRLQWFIEVEKPSQETKAGLDGMYVRLHVSIMRQRDKFPQHRKLSELIKLIIDEGNQHYERFLTVKKHLTGMKESEFLRPLAKARPRSTVRALQKVSDANYRLLLGLIRISFSFGDRAAGRTLEQARRAMFNLHTANHRLARLGAAPRFELPAMDSIPRATRNKRARSALHAYVDDLGNANEQAFSDLDTHGPPYRELARTQRSTTADVLQQTHGLIDQETSG